MKKLITAIFVMVLSLFTLTTFTAVGRDSKNTFVLPENLRIISQSTFEGTAVENVILSENVTSIEANAFADTGSLSDIYIPESVTYIADNAFENSALKTIHTVKGSHAEDWARKHDIQFVLDDIWTGTTLNTLYAELELLIYFCCNRVNPVKLIKPVSRTADEGKSMRPQERAELHAVDYLFP